MRSVSDLHALEHIRYVFEGGEVFRSNRRVFYRRALRYSGATVSGETQAVVRAREVLI
jgi:hypothetical protein